MRIYPLLLAVLLGLTQCQSDDTGPIFELTEATQTGAQTMSFRVHNRVWQNYGYYCFYQGGGCADHVLRATYAPPRRILQLTGGQTTKERTENFSLVLGPISMPGTYSSDQQIEQATLYFSDANQRGEIYRSTSTLPTTIVITRLDTVAKIVAGTFYGRMQNAFDSRTLDITEGRFDMRYTK